MTTYSDDMNHNDEIEDYGGYRLGGRSTAPLNEAIPVENVVQESVADAGN